jgi:hypothetical protein
MAEDPAVADLIFRSLVYSHKSKTFFGQERPYNILTLLLIDENFEKLWENKKGLNKK